jgi:hypothetical protein
MLQIVLIVVTLFSIVLMLKIKKTIADGQVSEDVLTKNEKLYIWIFSILDPVLAGAIFYYGWKKKLPKKAHQANQISMWAFLIVIVASLVFAFM